MAQKIVHKTPEELEEAVGKKIDELFGDAFAEEPAPVPLEQAPPARAEVAKPRPNVKPPMSASPSGPGRVSKPQRSVPPVPAARPATAGPAAGRRPVGMGFEDLVEQMDILLLDLEWEVSTESIHGLMRKFKELETFFPTDGQARTILAMNQRALRRFSGPDSVPHPVLVKLLQDSLTALRLIQTSQGKRAGGETLLAGISTSYREIMATAAPQAPKVREQRPPQEPRRPLGSLVKDIGSSVSSLREVGQRLARILAVLRQGGDMSMEEIARRLTTLEHLLSDRLAQLSTFQEELLVATSQGEVGAQDRPASKASVPERLLMVSWWGMGVAIPSSSVAAIYPLGKDQAEQFLDKSVIVIGSHQLSRLPLKKPEVNQKARVLPTLLIHLSHQGKNCFFLADRLMGLRELAAGTDLSSQSRIKIGANSYVILKPAMIR